MIKSSAVCFYPFLLIEGCGCSKHGLRSQTRMNLVLLLTSWGNLGFPLDLSRLLFPCVPIGIIFILTSSVPVYFSELLMHFKCMAECLAHSSPQVLTVSIIYLSWTLSSKQAYLLTISGVTCLFFFVPTVLFLFLSFEMSSASLQPTDWHSVYLLRMKSYHLQEPLLDCSNSKRSFLFVHSVCLLSVPFIEALNNTLHWDLSFIFSYFHNKTWSSMGSGAL